MKSVIVQVSGEVKLEEVIHQIGLTPEEVDMQAGLESVGTDRYLIWVSDTVRDSKLRCGS